MNWKHLLCRRTYNKFKNYRLINVPSWVFERGQEVNALQKFWRTAKVTIGR